MPQQLQQQQQPDPQMMQGLSNPEAAHMWQQRQSQMQNSYRPPQSGDLPTVQMNQQASVSLVPSLLAPSSVARYPASPMQDYARGQAFPQGQGQQAIVQQPQPTFGLGAQRMSGTSFHDPQGNQGQSLIPPNFNMRVNAQQMARVLNRNPMVQAAMNPTFAHQRQMMASQNPGGQQAPTLARPQQAGLGAQHAAKQPGATDMFTMPAAQDQMHGSPHPSMQQMGPPAGAQGQGQNAQRRISNIADAIEKRRILQTTIVQIEQRINHFTSTTRTENMSEHEFQQLATLRSELNARKELFNKISAALAVNASQQMAHGMVPTGMPHMSPVGTSAQPHPQVTGSVPNGQSNFVAQPNSNSPQPFGVTTTSGGPSPPNPQNPAMVNSQVPVQGRPNVPPVRAPVPHQFPGQVANAVPPNMANGNQFTHASGQITTSQSRANPMPLEKDRFESTYLQFCRSQRLRPTLHVQIAEGRVVHLYDLHVEVMREGGSMSVTSREYWSVIGGRMGFVQFPGNENDPPRCGPVIAQQLQHTYKEHLLQFESAYVMTMRNRQQQQSQQQQPMGVTTSGGVIKPPNAQAPTDMQRNGIRSIPPFLALAQYAQLSVADMRAKNLPEATINAVETYRPTIMRYHQEMTNRANQQQNRQNPQGQMPNIPEHVPLGVPPGAQRPPQAMISGSASAVPISEQKPLEPHFAPYGNGGRYSTPEEVHREALASINAWKNMFMSRLQSMQRQDVPEGQRLEYNQLLEQVYKLTTELEAKLPTYVAILRNEEMMRRCVAMVISVARQKQLMTMSPPQYIVSLSTLRNMFAQIQSVHEEVDQKFRLLRSGSANNQVQSQAPLVSANRPASISVPTVQPVNIPQHAPPAHSISNRQISSNPPPPTLSLPVQQQQQPVHVKKPVQSSVPSSPSNLAAPANIPSPTPRAPSTPAASVTTPQTQTAGSPQTPKSPKPKVGVRPKIPPRLKKPSSSTKGAATPEAAPTPVAGVKRPPEDEVAPLSTATQADVVPSSIPSPKKVRTEWEGEPSEALVKRQQEGDNIKTEEDALAFLDQMKELLAMTATTDNSVHSDIAASLDQILAGVAQEPADAAATAAAISEHIARDTGPPPTALSPHQGPANDALLEFFDFSSFTTLEDEESNSKAPTPDLVPSSEANPSPESGSDADLMGGSPDKTKNEESTDLDILRLGPLKGIDGGESTYYQSAEWKWDGPMLTPDQPWPMFTAS
ncbi:hypothetical protein ID866_2719 [Astraeus odoratus]|nr:hypothetical protein ID866_2719 [Astraeus odoratus]